MLRPVLFSGYLFTSRDLESRKPELYQQVFINTSNPPQKSGLRWGRGVVDMWVYPDDQLDIQAGAAKTLMDAGEMVISTPHKPPADNKSRSAIELGWPPIAAECFEQMFPSFIRKS